MENRVASMRRYARRSETDYDYYLPSLTPDLTVFENGPDWQPIGLCFPDGEDIMARVRAPIGFVHFTQD